MNDRYASDDLVFKAMNLSRAAMYVYQFSEAHHVHEATINQISGILPALERLHSATARLVFAVCESRQPFQICPPVDGTFVLLISGDATMYLYMLCMRLQTQSALADFLGNPRIQPKKDFTGQYLLDITKQMVFHPEADLDMAQYMGIPHTVFQATLLHIIAHEVAHAIHGHLTFRNSAEFKQFSMDRDDFLLTMRTLEMDADSSATTSVFALAESGNDALKLNNVDLPTEELTRRERAMRREYVTGIILGHIFQDTLTSNFAPGTHPSTYVRYPIRRDTPPTPS
jgi:hypothetical protein